MALNRYSTRPAGGYRGQHVQNNAHLDHNAPHRRRRVKNNAVVVVHTRTPVVFAQMLQHSFYLTAAVGIFGYLVLFYALFKPSDNMLQWMTEPI